MHLPPHRRLNVNVCMIAQAVLEFKNMKWKLLSGVFFFKEDTHIQSLARRRACVGLAQCLITATLGIPTKPPIQDSCGYSPKRSRAVPALSWDLRQRKLTREH
jgi:hypothetical protein